MHEVDNSSQHFRLLNVHYLPTYVSRIIKFENKLIRELQIRLPKLIHFKRPFVALVSESQSKGHYLHHLFE